MKWYWVKTGWFIKKLFPGYIWDIPNTGNTVYLTFDDGPTPEITEWVLHTLNKYNIKATFFCIGNNIDKHPEIFRKLLDDGHAIGNHTYSHPNGWDTQNTIYADDVSAGENSISTPYPEFTNNKLFRPPYGKLKRIQAKQIRKKGYKIIMWDVLSADFDMSISKEKCLKNVIESVRSGSIIIFHDSKKAAKNMQYALPIVIEELDKRGFQFDVIR